MMLKIFIHIFFKSTLVSSHIKQLGIFSYGARIVFSLKMHRKNIEVNTLINDRVVFLNFCAIQSSQASGIFVTFFFNFIT